MRFLDLEAMAARHSFSVSFLRILIRKEGCPHYRKDRKIWLEEDEFANWFTCHYRVGEQCTVNHDKSIDDILISVLDGLQHIT